MKAPYGDSAVRKLTYKEVLLCSTFIPRLVSLARDDNHEGSSRNDCVKHDRRLEVRKVEKTLLPQVFLQQIATDQLLAGRYDYPHVWGHIGHEDDNRNLRAIKGLSHVGTSQRRINGRSSLVTASTYNVMT
jgi:hypothetical protein